MLWGQQGHPGRRRRLRGEEHADIARLEGAAGAGDDVDAGAIDRTPAWPWLAPRSPTTSVGQRRDRGACRIVEIASQAAGIARTVMSTAEPAWAAHRDVEHGQRPVEEDQKQHERQLLLTT